MTEKRFTWLKKDVYAPQIVITDSLTEKDLTPTDCYGLLNELAKENEQLKQELFESEKEHLIETYSDNSVRKNDKIHSLKKEFKERFGRDFE